MVMLLHIRFFFCNSPVADDNDNNNNQFTITPFVDDIIGLYFFPFMEWQLGRKFTLRPTQYTSNPTIIFGIRRLGCAYFNA